MTKYEQIVFAQGADAAEPLAILNDEGYEAAMDYLSQWWYPGEHEIADRPGAGTSDAVMFDKPDESGDYFILTANTGIGYIGLERALVNQE